MKIVLYCAPRSSATPVACALDELGVAHERVMLDLSTGAQRRPEFLALNPNGKVPTMVVDGTPMFEALAIIQWLGDRFGVEKGLWPAADSAERLVALSWSTWAYVTFGPTVGRLNQASNPRIDAKLHNQAQAEAARHDLQQLLGMIEGRLSQQPYLLGERYSLVDQIVAGSVGYSTFFGTPLEPHPHLLAWFQRWKARPAVASNWSFG